MKRLLVALSMIYIRVLTLCVAVLTHTFCLAVFKLPLALPCQWHAVTCNGPSDQTSPSLDIIIMSSPKSSKVAWSEEETHLLVSLVSKHIKTVSNRVLVRVVRDNEPNDCQINHSLTITPPPLQLNRQVLVAIQSIGSQSLKILKPPHRRNAAKRLSRLTFKASLTHLLTKCPHRRKRKRLLLRMATEDQSHGGQIPRSIYLSRVLKSSSTKRLVK